MRYEIALIAAMTPDRLIGADGRIPWHVKADMQHFKETTMGHDVIMGRKTYESIKRAGTGGRVLPGRHVIVLSRTMPMQHKDDLSVVRTIEQAIAFAQMPKERIFVAGGGEIYPLFFGKATEMYITYVYAEASTIESLVYFPQWNRDAWEELSCVALPRGNGEPQAFTSHLSLL